MCILFRQEVTGAQDAANASLERLQPNVLVMGTYEDPTEVFCCFNGALYRQPDVQTALLHVTKIHWVFDLRYSNIAKSFYQLVEMVLLNFHSASAPLCTGVHRFLESYQEPMSYSDAWSPIDVSEVGRKNDSQQKAVESDKSDADNEKHGDEEEHPADPDDEEHPNDEENPADPDDEDHPDREEHPADPDDEEHPGDHANADSREGELVVLIAYAGF